MRDPIKLLQHRATKVPAIRDFLNAIDERSLEDIEELDIKKSDKKLLRTHFQRIVKHENDAKLNAWLGDAIKNMPTNDEEYMYRIYVYEGEPMTYSGYEIRTGDIVTLHDDWIRFDYYRIKVDGSVQPILNHCRYLDTMNITDANKLIFDMLNHRNGGPTGFEDRTMFRIQRG